MAMFSQCLHSLKSDGREYCRSQNVLGEFEPIDLSYKWIDQQSLP